jgi:teichuronic acid exporter
MSFKRTFFKNLFVSGGFTYLTQLVTLSASFITSRLLAPADFGLVGLITVFSGFISAFSENAIAMAVIRSEYRQTYYRGLNYLSILLGIILCTSTILLIYPISLFYNNYNIIWPGIVIAFLFIGKSVSIVPTALLQKELQFGKAGRILFFSTLLGTISTIIMAYLDASYWSLIWSQYVSAIVSFIILFSAKKAIFSRTRLVVVRKTFRLARKLIGSIIGFNMVNYWARNADNLIVGRYYGTNDLGIYNRAYMMLMMPLNLITGIFSSVLLPSFVKHKKEGGDVESEYYFILKIISFLNFPIAMILLLFPEKLVLLLWGENWIEVAKLLPYFGLLILTQTLTSTLGNLLVVQKEEKILMFTGWINSAFMVTGIIIGSFFSLVSIAAFYSLAYIVLVLPFSIIYVFIIRLRFRKGVFAFWVPRIFLSAVMWVAIYINFYDLLLFAIIIWMLIVFWNSRTEINSIIRSKLKLSLR